MRERLDYLKSAGKIASKYLVPFVTEYEFFEPFGKYRLPFTIISGSVRLIGLVLGFTEHPNAFYGYAAPTVMEAPALIRDEIKNRV